MGRVRCKEADPVYKGPPLYSSAVFFLIKRGGMFESCAHGVGSIAFSGGFSEPLFDGDGKPLAFAGRAEAVPVQEGGLEFGSVFRAGLPENGFVSGYAFHHEIH